MGFAKGIKMAMLDKGIKTAALAEMTELKPENIYNSLSKDNMTYERASLLAEALGCEIVIRDKETGKVY